jgi:hypothetical protein
MIPALWAMGIDRMDKGPIIINGSLEARKETAVYGPPTSCTYSHPKLI